jgi:hypothetical protein
MQIKNLIKIATHAEFEVRSGGMRTHVIWDTTTCSPWKPTDVSEEHTVPISGVTEKS